jgi:hypothetical protein
MMTFASVTSKKVLINQIVPYLCNESYKTVTFIFRELLPVVLPVVRSLLMTRKQIRQS